MKKIVIACVISSVVALGIAGGAGWGIYHFMNKGAIAKAAKSTEIPEENQDESSSIFVSLPETVVTLHDSEGTDRYMVAELVMVVDSEKDAEKIKKDEPLYQSITVDELSNMKYEEIRALKISDIRKKVFENLKIELAKRKMATPYKDILVKKVVFQ
ncbi:MULTISPECIES: flagellar basal body-associated FliL family protein [unclassified Citrobacter]|uniref:flagellar basal body-associated FliL family protein n=1 Tax=unclassified Citrobacter TaxID=2644389 RepID=UPI0015EAF5E6|nr:MULTISPECIES: flagellar basal body-associated FliL family protein [unclassified Citrobacter]MBA7874184.1 flagellar basal body-associated FliL family protein [Citrobacter sp. RHBSTW-00827]MBA7939962.1 flagellar basal body-associated FliL family protein [Citrobacter sp. RHBSTW-00509]QLS95992.1 flagellar basal body-associated FliL family protein [Citrobacter sp. RHBSTW-00859]QLT55367.1 flagellar basal body-associated FliL family protein [Citrobacter sp. RHBSTW-00821]QLU31649.1 flagellar basal 